MNVYTWEVLKQTFPFHFKKEVYICSVNFSSTIYLNDFITYTLQIKYYMVKTFHVFHYGNIFFVLVEFLSLNRKSQNWNVFQQGIWNFRTLFLHTIHNCCWHCEVVVTVQTDHVNKKEDGTATNKEWILYADYIFLIWIIHCLHYDVYKVALC